jgi:hypothetical protein
MTLPATMAEALAFAREWIARMRQGNFMGLGGTPWTRLLVMPSRGVGAGSVLNCIRRR